MGIKYNKKRPLDEARERFVVYGRTSEEPGLSLRGKLLIVYAGIAAFVFLAFALGGAGSSFFGTGTREGTGTVAAKSIERFVNAEAAYVVELRIDLAPGLVESDRFATDPAWWEKLEPGQQVRVIYDVDRDGAYQRVRHVGLLEESSASAP